MKLRNEYITIGTPEEGLVLEVDWNTEDITVYEGGIGPGKLIINMEEIPAVVEQLTAIHTKYSTGKASQ